MPNPKRRDGARHELDHDPVRLRTRRVEMGLTQAELATKADTSGSHISELESGTRNPSPPLLKRLADALDCKTRDIMPDRTPAAVG